MAARMIALFVVAAALCVPVGMPAAASGAAGGDHASLARTLAENILGSGQVRSSRSSDGGRTLHMVWESPTFKPAHAQAYTRELLQAEAGLTWGAISRALEGVREFHFEIVIGRRTLCTGSVGRTRPMVITYARDLDG